MNNNNTAKGLFNIYNKYKDENVSRINLSYNYLQKFINNIKNNNSFNVNLEGKSVEQRAIHSIKFGDGKKSVLMWSQMHGNEPTATLALLDIFNYLSDKIVIM